jgi:predicted HAD superfamily Cof-like phosphohydrolase
MKQLKQVTEFMKMSDHPILSEPQIPSNKRCALRVELIDEELNELREALYKYDIVETADAICDLLFVVLGAANEFGLNAKLEALFDEVTRSNMSKACNTHKEAVGTLRYYEEHKAVLCEIVEHEDKYLVRRLSDGKQLKCVYNYSEPNLESIINS